jgi:CRP/FNR family transcriptional regulator, cyclic AMP receptor protein
MLRACHHLLAQTVPPGTLLLAEGTKTGRLFVLAEGEFRIMQHGVEIAVINEPGAIIGEISALLGIPHTATAEATAQSSVYVIEDAETFLRHEPEAVFAIAQTLAQRLKAASGYLSDVKSQYGDRADHLGMIDTVLTSLVHQQFPMTQSADENPADPRL